ncbi:MAG: DUF2169 domain-containing protein [Polyangiaceae bacterium]
MKWPEGREPAGTERATVIVKITFLVAPPGVLRVAPPDALEPLTLDAFDADGGLVYPSDFAVHKPSCDVVVVGRDVALRAAEGSIGVNGGDKRARPRESLGPRETFCMNGDPTDPYALRVWSSGKVDFARFQSAPPDQRIPHPRGAFTVRYQRDGVSLEARFNGPEPTVQLLERSGRRVGSVPLTLDTIALRPSDQRACLVWRGVATYPAGTTVAAVDLHGAQPSDPFSWPRASVAEPSKLRNRERVTDAGGDPARTEEPADRDRTAFVQALPPSGNPLPFSTGAPNSVRSGSTQFLSALPPESPEGGASDFRSGETRLVTSFRPGAATPFEGASARADEHDPSREGTAPRVERVRASTLPFKRVTADTGPPPSSERLTADDFAKLRSNQTPVVEAWRAAEGTRMTRGMPALPSMDGSAPPGSAPFAPPPSEANDARGGFPPVVGAPLRALGAGALVGLPPVVTPMIAPAISSAPTAAPARDGGAGALAPDGSATSDSASKDKLVAIQREVWNGERLLADILADHGMTELEWRAEKRKAKK